MADELEPAPYKFYDKDVDLEILQERAREWIEHVLQEDLDPGVSLGDLLADGNILHRVGEKVLTIYRETVGEDLCPGEKSKTFTRTVSTWGTKVHWDAIAHVDSFLKVCRQVGLADVHLCTPPDVVEQKSLLKVCVCIRTLAIRLFNIQNSRQADEELKQKSEPPTLLSSGTPSKAHLPPSASASEGHVDAAVKKIDGGHYDYPSIRAAPTDDHDEEYEFTDEDDTGGQNVGAEAQRVFIEGHGADAEDRRGHAEASAELGHVGEPDIGQPLVECGSRDRDRAGSQSDSSGDPQARVGDAGPGAPEGGTGGGAPEAGGRKLRRRRSMEFGQGEQGSPSASGGLSSIGGGGSDSARKAGERGKPAVRRRSRRGSIGSLEDLGGASETLAQDEHGKGESSVGRGRRPKARDGASERQRGSLRQKRRPVVARKSPSAVERFVPAALLEQLEKLPLGVVIGGAVAAVGLVGGILLRIFRPKREYKVQKGDCLIQIAQKVGKKDWREIYDQNPELENPNIIRTEAVLKV